MLNSFSAKQETIVTDFSKIDLTVASTRGGRFHCIVFDVRSEDWPDIRAGLMARDPAKTLKFREEGGPRDSELTDDYRWVWVVMTVGTPLGVLIHLTEFSRSPFHIIRFRPTEYP